MGVRVFGVSRDTESSHQKFKDKLGLPFPLLSDVEGRMCEAFGVWKEKSLYGRKYMGIERTTVVIGSDGKIERLYPKVSVKGHVDQVIRDLNAAD
jgi:peroxiredoxin Q/BCP